MFDPNKLYFANDSALLAIVPYSTLAHWRCEGRGPNFVKLGHRVGYKGSDLNAWIEAQTVKTGSDDPPPKTA